MPRLPGAIAGIVVLVGVLAGCNALGLNLVPAVDDEQLGGWPEEIDARVRCFAEDGAPDITYIVTDGRAAVISPKL